jgi:hypothetical protein
MNQIANMSAQQQVIWFAEQVGMDAGTAYNSVVAVEVPALDLARLRAALRGVVGRHGVLRMRTAWSPDGDPIHVYLDEDEPVLDVAPAAENLSAALRAVGAAARESIDTDHTAPVRWLVVPYEDGQHLLAQIEHHFVHDGVSMWLVLSGIAEHYRTNGAGCGPVEETLSYQDYVRWQDEWLASAEAAEQADYWLSRLAGAETVLRWPNDEARPEVFSGRGGTHEIELPPALTDAVQECAGLVGGTSFAVLMAVFAALLAQECHQQRLTLGTMLRNRSEPPGTARSVGMFVNTVAVPLDVSIPFEELVRDITGQIGDAHDHEELPFVNAVRQLGLRPDLSRNSIFQACFSMNDVSQQWVDFDGQQRRVHYPDTGSAKFDLDVVVLPEPGATRVLWRYYGPLFGAEQVASLARRWVEDVTCRAGVPMPRDVA